MIRPFILAALTAAAPAAAQSPPVQTPVTVIRSSDCISVHADGEPWDECGFQAMALNGAGDRILTVSALGRIELWDRAGRSLAAAEPRVPQPGGHPSGSALIAGNFAAALSSYRRLVVFDATTGAIVVDRDLGTRGARLVGLIAPHHVLLDHRLENWEMALSVIDLRTGEIVAQRLASATMERAMLPLIAGYANDSPRGRSLHYLANSALEPFALTDCGPIGPPLQCLRYEQGSRQVERIDAATGRRSLDILPVEIGPRTQVQFVPAGTRLFARVCDPGPRPGNFVNPSDCRIVDVDRGRILYRYRASITVLAVGEDESGGPELRLATAYEPVGSPYEIRRIPADGDVTLVATSARMATLILPGGGMMVPDPVDPAIALLLARDGSVRARLPFDAGGCRMSAYTFVNAQCAFSDDRRTLATMGDGVALWALPPL